MLTTVLLGAAGVRSLSTHNTSPHSLLQIIAFLAGYATQDIRLALYIGLAGTALTFLVVVPPWPFFNKHPENWLPASNATSTAGISIDVDGHKVG
tara:strand:- start:10045 stop:10329 length:285 start_codon:yes stop_codon:yes gene_type:complete